MKKLIFILQLLLTGCAAGTTGSYEVNRFVSNFNATYPKQHGLVFTGVGVSFPKDKLLLLHLSYNSKNTTDIEAARILMVELVEKTLHKINNDPSMQAILKPYPFTYKNIDVSIGFIDSNHNFFSSESGSLAIAGRVKDKIYYSVEKNPFAFSKVHEETYAEAYEKVYGKPLQE